MMRMRPKTSDSPAASRNSNIPKEMPLRVCTIQKSMAASPPLFAEGPLERDQPGSLDICFGGHPQELIYSRNGLDDHGYNLVSNLVDSGDYHICNDVLIGVKTDMTARCLQVHVPERLQKLGLLLDLAAGGREGLVDSGECHIGGFPRPAWFASILGTKRLHEFLVSGIVNSVDIRLRSVHPQRCGA